MHAAIESSRKTSVPPPSGEPATAWQFSGAPDHWGNQSVIGRLSTAPEKGVGIRMLVRGAGEPAVVLFARDSAGWNLEDVSAAAPAPVARAPAVIPIAANNGIADAEWAREKMALSMAELATLAGVTRKAVYDWFDGAKPRMEVSSRLAGIRSVFEPFDSEAIRFAGRFWSAPLSDGRPFLDALKAIDGPGSAEAQVAREALSALLPAMMSLVERSQEKPRRHDLGTAHTEDLFRSI